MSNNDNSKRRIDYVFKAFVIRNGLDKVERELSYECFRKRDYSKYLEVTARMSDKGDEKAWKEARKINNATYERRKRLSKRIESFLLDSETGCFNECVFLTLTFRDDVLASTTPKERRNRVSRFLKSQNARYVANIDFGKINGREHYHALIQKSKVDYTPWNNQNGSIQGERITTYNSKSLAKYIAKMTNHALKETTKRQALIYSR